MCIAAFIWQADPLYPFLLLLNRDEYHDRPTKPVGWWEDGQILGGIDEVAGGTWLACSRGGKVAFVTNVLELHALPQAQSRGQLPVRFLQSAKNPREFGEILIQEAHRYNGFNLILADLPSRSMVYISNRPNIKLQDVSPGIHVISNANLDSPWPKVERLGFNLNKIWYTYHHDHLQDEIPIKDMINFLMKDTTKADKTKLPHICSLEWEYSLSSIFVQVDTPLGLYGTRSTAALTVNKDGKACFYETYLENNMWKEKTHTYCIQKL